ncbi:MAG: flagellar biosynthetic protein FliO [Planctomycetota bacterium]|jgi:flagellar biogenesis protein FliO
MGLSKKKIVIFSLTVVLCSGAALAYSAQSDADESTKSLFYKSDSLYGNQSNLTAASDDNFDTGELFYKMMLMVLLVVVFGAAAIYLSKKLLPRFSCLPGKRIQVAETVHLGPRKAIHLIKIGKHTLLIGSTNENITKLADVTGQLSEVNLPTKSISDN